MEYVSGVADRTPAAAKYDFTVHGVPHLFGRKRNVMPPFALDITAGDFAFAAYRSISLVPGPCMQRRPFHGSSPAFTSTNPDTRRRAVEYRQMESVVRASPITGISKARRSRPPLQRIERICFPADTCQWPRNPYRRGQSRSRHPVMSILALERNRQSAIWPLRGGHAACILVELVEKPTDSSLADRSIAGRG
jgi:hypothetical protein